MPRTRMSGCGWARPIPRPSGAVASDVMSGVPLSERTLRLVRRMFPSDRQAAVVAALEDRCGSGLQLWVSTSPEGLERIRFAVMKLGCGSSPEFERALAIANIDWRDVLVAAGLGSSLVAHLEWADAQWRS